MLEGLDPSTLPVEPSIFLVVAARRELFRSMYGGDLGVSAAGVIGLTPGLALFSLSLRRASKGAPGRVGRTGVVASVSPLVGTHPDLRLVVLSCVLSSSNSFSRSK